MKKIIMIIGLSLLLIACGKEETEKINTLSQDDIENLQETSELGVEAIVYEGDYKGTLKGKESELKIEGDSFNFTYGGNHSFGGWNKVDDGSIIELDAEKGSLPYRFYNYSDEDTWTAMTDSLTFTEPEEFLHRVE